MPRYIIEHDLSPSRGAASTEEGSRACRVIGGRSFASQVTWLHAYMSPDWSKSFCIYAAPTPEAVQRVASLNDLPVQEITEVLSPGAGGFA
jgi:hypothetical protein